MFGDQREQVCLFNSRTPRVEVAERLAFYRVPPLENQSVHPIARSWKLPY